MVDHADGRDPPRSRRPDPHDERRLDRSVRLLAVLSDTPRRPRAALLGGSFDPVHLGHLHLAREALGRLALTEVRFLPAYVPPHKRDRALLPIDDRLLLLDAALRDEPAFVVDPREARRGRACYTFDTLTELRAELGSEAEVMFLIGGDSLRDLPKWYRAPDLVRTFTLVTVPRDPDVDVERLLAPVRLKFPADLVEKLRRFVLPVEPLPVSSTEIRARVRDGRPIDDLVPAAVARLIEERGYYA